MSKSLECATMIIDTGYNTVPLGGGSISSVYTFNVDLRQILGDMYDKYDFFGICLNSVVNYAKISSYNLIPPQAPNPTFGSNGSALVGMTGLNWLHNTLNGIDSTLGLFPNAFQIGGGGATGDGAWGTGEFKYANVIMFSKPNNPYTTLTVGLYSARNSAFIRYGNSSQDVRQQLNYNFSIFGIDHSMEEEMLEEETKKEKRRIK